MVDRSRGPEVKPEVVFVFELIEDVIKGKIRVPNFQRPFVWRRDQMRDLLDSVYREYPIGSLLFWETEIVLSSVSWIGPVKLPDVGMGPLSYLLDGHQRLSTLVGVLAPRNEDQSPRPGDDDPRRWEIWFNASTDEFEHPGPSDFMRPWHFPLHKLLDTVGFLEEAERMRTQGGERGQEYVSKMQQLVRRFQVYKLPVIKIKNTDLNNAVDVFARLNSTGRRMTPDQMVSALTYAEHCPGEVRFRLADEIDRLLEMLDDRGFGGLDRTIVLRAALATMDEDIYETNWTRLSQKRRVSIQEGLPQAIDPTRDALEEAVGFLTRINVFNDRLLPYAMQMVVLSAFFSRCRQPTEDQLSFLERWFWVSSFTGWFASSNPSRISRLVKELREVVSNNPSPDQLENQRLDEPALPFPATFTTASARARVFLCVLLNEGPLLPEGPTIERPWRLIAEHGPRAIGYISTNREVDKDLRSSPANRILKVDISKRADATTWLLELGDEHRDAVLKSHGIPIDAFEDLKRGSIDDFLQKRQQHLIELECAFMKKVGVTLPVDRTPMPSAIDTDE
jgi:hypothetical protein